MNKKLLSERDICTKFITPALTRAGWDELTQIREEVSFTKGRIIVRGKLVTRGKAKRADYILYYKPNIPIALIEAKDNNHGVGDGMQQALDYAETLHIPFVFSSNGDGFVLAFREFVDGRQSFIKTTKALPQNWMNVSLGRTGCRLSAVASLWDSAGNTFSGHELRAELVLDDESADEHFLALQTEKDNIERGIGEQLTWHRPENIRMRRIYLRRSADLESRKDRPEYCAWLLAKLELFHKTFAPRVRDLD